MSALFIKIMPRRNMPDHQFTVVMRSGFSHAMEVHQRIRTEAITAMNAWFKQQSAEYWDGVEKIVMSPGVVSDYAKVFAGCQFAAQHLLTVVGFERPGGRRTRVMR